MVPFFFLPSLAHDYHSIFTFSMDIVIASAFLVLNWVKRDMSINTTVEMMLEKRAVQDHIMEAHNSNFS